MRFVAAGLAVLLLFVVLSACEEAVPRPSDSSGWNVKVVMLDVPRMEVDGTIAWHNFEIPEITKEVMERGRVSVFTDISSRFAWYPLPYIHESVNGYATFAITEGWLALQLTSNNPNAVLGMAMAWGGRYRLKVIIEWPPS